MSISPPIVDVELSAVPPGSVALVHRVDAPEGDAERLKRLGVCIGRRLMVVQHGDPLIVRVHGTRIGLSARLAACVRVHPCCREAGAVLPEAGGGLSAACVEAGVEAGRP